MILDQELLHKETKTNYIDGYSKTCKNGLSKMISQCINQGRGKIIKLN